MKCRWTLASAQPELASQLAAALNVSPLLAQCLLNRGHSDLELANHFLHPRLQHLADPFLLPNMSGAVERLLQAHARNELLVIFGDYDVDGVTSTALLTEVLRRLGWNIASYLPHRLDEGYGLTQSAVESCLGKFPATLLLAVDCGSTAVDSIRWLSDRGVDAIILDHHQVSDPPPNACAIVNPQLRRSAEPGSALPAFAELCSVGLAFKLAHAVVKRGREIGLPGALEFDLRPLLDLVALGTIADLVPLTGENRILVTAGLERLNSTKRPGLVVLKRVAQIARRVGGYEVGFQLAPRLNAAGRLETAEEALALLMARDEAEAEPLAHSLDARNRERQRIEQTIANETIGAVRAKFSPATDCVIVEGQLLWHIGVVGIVASRVLQEFYRPTIIVGGDGSAWRGSGRSIEGFDLAAALRECGDLLVRHGGHAMAAGLTILPEKIDLFRTRLNELARRALTPEQLKPALRLDGEVTLPELTVGQVTELDKLQQTGMGNPGVQLVVRGLTHHKEPQRMGENLRHAKLWVSDNRSSCEAVLWGIENRPLPSGRFDLAVAPQINEFNGACSVQLKVLDWCPSAP